MSDMQEQLVQLGGGAHALASQLLGNADEAADAVQDAITTVLAKPETYDASRGPLKPWFLRIVRNRCLDVIRQRRGAGVEPDTLASTAPGPEKVAAESERSDTIRRALAALPADRCEIVILRDYLDLSYAEIASVMGIPPGTVMSRLHRARLALREALIAYEL